MMHSSDKKPFIHKPPWLKVNLPKGENYSKLRKLVDENKLATICQSGNCPNMSECWSAGTATFLILGDVCTRNCSFCGVPSGKPTVPDPDEPYRVAEAVRIMRLGHCVITSVTRDDLPDKGAAFWAETIIKIKEINPLTTIEVLIPDMKDDSNALGIILNASPDIISHNMETVRRLYPEIRPQANYSRSLRQIKATAEAGFPSKSGFMLGLGESPEEIEELIDDLYWHKTSILTIGQYLPPSEKHFPLKEYIHPNQFETYRHFALAKGIKVVESSPLVRSSYHSGEHLDGL